jgi:hypothetical protein
MTYSIPTKDDIAKVVAEILPNLLNPNYKFTKNEKELANYFANKNQYGEPRELALMLGAAIHVNRLNKIALQGLVILFKDQIMLNKKLAFIADINIKMAGNYKENQEIVSSELNMIVAASKARGKKAIDIRHNQPGGSRDKQARVRQAWSSGRYKSRDICAEQKCGELEMSFAAARKALRNTPKPT